MTGIILAGGKNSRMGRKKALIEVNGKRIMDNIIDVFKGIFKEIIIVTNTPEDFEYTNLKLVKDIIPDKGALGGVYSGIEMAKYEECFVTACDMPHVNESLIKYIIGIKGYDIVVPKLKGGYEPLFAAYSKSCSVTIRKQLSENNLKITQLFSKVKVKELYENEIRIYDEELLSFINVNTPEELKMILNLY